MQSMIQYKKVIFYADLDSIVITAYCQEKHWIQIFHRNIGYIIV